MWVVPWKMEQVRTLTTSEMSHKDGVWMSLNTTNSIHTARRKLTLGCVIILHQSRSVLIIYWLEKVMATHSSTLAWKIPWMEEPGRLQSMGRWGLDTTERLHFHLSLFTLMHWRRIWQPTLVFLPGESQGRGILVGCRLWGCTESDTTEVTQQQQQQVCHSFSSREQASSNFMAAVTIHIDFGAQEKEVSHCFHCFPICLS